MAEKLQLKIPEEKIAENIERRSEETKKFVEKYTPKNKEECVQMTVEIPKEHRKKLKTLAARNELKIKDAVKEAIDDYIKKNNEVFSG